MLFRRELDVAPCFESKLRLGLADDYIFRRALPFVYVFYREHQLCASLIGANPSPAVRFFVLDDALEGDALLGLREVV